MEIFSGEFFALWVASLVIYFSFGKRIQWIILLGMSLLFFVSSIQTVPIVLLGVWISTYLGGILRGLIKEKRIEKIIGVGIVTMCVILLFCSRRISFFSVLGSSYFTLKAIGYYVDVGRDGFPCEKNPFKYLLFLIYLPTITQGPFNRYGKFKDALNKQHEIDYVRLTHGAQRFLWGAFKKLVIVMRLSMICEYVYSDFARYNGATLLIVLLAYAVYFYLDFSSYMDMMIGMSETFGVTLPENFRQPFFSKSVAEFWRRWHCTLGNWFKDYVMMVFTQSSFGRSLRKNFKKLGKKASKLAPIIVGTILVWVCTAMWHGNDWRYILWGSYYCVIIVASILFEDSFRRVKHALRIKEKNRVYAIFQILRTVGIVLVADVIIVLNNASEYRMFFKQLLGKSFLIGKWMDYRAIGWGRMDLIVLVGALIVVISVSVMKELGKDVLCSIDRMILPIRWMIYYAVFFTTILYGLYGSQYDASQFYYMGF